MRAGRFIAYGFLVLATALVIWQLDARYFSVLYSFNYRLTTTFEDGGKPFSSSGVYNVTLKRHRLRIPGVPYASFEYNGEAIPIRFSNGALVFIAVNVATTEPRYGFTGHWPFEILFLGHPNLQPKDLPQDPVAVPTEYLPTIIRFRNLQDRFSAEAVVRDRIADIAGTGSKFVSMTVAITEDPVTRGLVNILPWVVSPDDERDLKPIKATPGLNLGVRQFMYRNDWVFSPGI